MKNKNYTMSMSLAYSEESNNTTWCLIQRILPLYSGMENLGFLFLDKCLKVKSYKSEVVIRIATLAKKKEVMRLNGMLKGLNNFILKATQHTLLFYKLLKKEAHFKLTIEFKKKFVSLKTTLLTLSMLSWLST